MSRSRRAMWMLSLALVVAACSGAAGDEASSTETDLGSTDASADGPDNCTLITEEEATELAGHELVVLGDSILGCGFVPPGADVADVVVNAAELDGDAASVAEEGFPNADAIIPVSVGGDTVAVTTPAGDTIASIVTADGGRVVELAIVFVGIDPDDMARIEEAAELAVTALGRWDA